MKRSNNRLPLGTIQNGKRPLTKTFYCLSFLRDSTQPPVGETQLVMNGEWDSLWLDPINANTVQYGFVLYNVPIRCTGNIIIPTQEELRRSLYEDTANPYRVGVQNFGEWP